MDAGHLTLIVADLERPSLYLNRRESSPIDLTLRSHLVQRAEMTFSASTMNFGFSGNWSRTGRWSRTTISRPLIRTPITPAILAGYFLLILTLAVRAGSCAPLKIEQSPAADITLSWGSAGCRLESADEPIGLWVVVPNASSPYSLGNVVRLSGKKFFRVLSTNGNCSPNVVGFVRQKLASRPTVGLRHLVANPFNRADHRVNHVLLLSDAYIGTLMERWDVVSQRFVTNRFEGSAAGWALPATLEPGEGFFLDPVGPDPLFVTWIGEVPEAAALVNSLPPAGLRALRSSIVPQTVPIGDQTSVLGFPAEDGDLLEVFDTAAQRFSGQYEYLDGFGWGPLSGADFGSKGPVITAGMGFSITKSRSATKATWITQFVVSGGCMDCGPVTLNIRLLSDPLNLVELSWSDPSYHLQTSLLAVPNGWFNIEGASPLMLPTDGSARFFKLSCP